MYEVAKRLITNGHKPWYGICHNEGLWPFVISLFAIPYTAWLCIMNILMARVNKPKLFANICSKDI